MKKAWLIKVSIDNHTYDDSIILCDDDELETISDKYLKYLK